MQKMASVTPVETRPPAPPQRSAHGAGHEGGRGRRGETLGERPLGFALYSLSVTLGARGRTDRT